MKLRIVLGAILTIGVLAAGAGAAERPLAFEDAEGFGAYARGGTGGRTLWVETREDSDKPGSLRWALNQKGPRIVQFRVGGVFELDRTLKIEEPFLTLDGSTAPEPVTLKDGALQVEGTHDIVIRHLRVRPGDEAVLGKGRWAKNPRPVKSSDAVSVKRSTDVIVDHVSASWSTDETISVTNSRRVTVQRCLIAEPLANPALHIENGVPISHAYGAIVQGDEVSYLKNLIVYFKIRGPQLASPEGGPRVRSAAVNNLVAFYEGSGTRVKASRDSADYVVRNNVYRHPLRPGAPEIEVLAERIWSEGLRNVAAAETKGKTRIHVSGNLGPIRKDPAQDEWAGVRARDLGDVVAALRTAEPPFRVEPLALLPTGEVEAYVLAHAGATRPRRDPIDERVIAQFRAGTGKVIFSQDDVGGYGPLRGK